MTERFRTKKSLGQHFLNSPAVPRWMCDAAAVAAGDVVVEIGPGTGALTRELLARGAIVVAIETDQRAIEVLGREFAAPIGTGQLRLIAADARQVDLASLQLHDHAFKVVANIPYYLTGHLFRVFLESPIQPQTLVFLVQKEVARRAAAALERGEKASLLSLSIQVFGQPAYIRTVGRGHFTPPPNVDSAILAIRNISRDRFADLHPQTFFYVLHRGFSAKRKQLAGNLATAYPKDRVLSALQLADLPPTIRAEDVPLEKWLVLATSLSSDRLD